MAVGGGLSGIPRSFDENSDSLGNAPNLNKVSSNEIQPEGSKPSAQPETSSNMSPTSGNTLKEHDYSRLLLASNTKKQKVATQPSGSSQNKNKTNFFQLVLKKTKNGLTRLTKEGRLSESCINLVQKKKINEEVKESNTIQPSEEIESTSTLKPLDTADEQPSIHSYDKVSPKVPILNDVKIGINDNVNIPTSIEPNVSIDFAAKLLYKISSNLFVRSYGRLNEPTSLDSLEVAVDPNPNVVQKNVSLYVNDGPGQAMGVSIVTDGQDGTRVGIRMTQDLANTITSLKAVYSPQNRDSISDRDLSPIHDGINAINNTIARFIGPKLHNTTEKGKVSDSVKITNLSGSLAGGLTNLPSGNKATAQQTQQRRVPKFPGQGPVGTGKVTGTPADQSQNKRWGSVTTSAFGNANAPGQAKALKTPELGKSLEEKSKNRGVGIAPAALPYKHVESKNALTFKERILQKEPQNKTSNTDSEPLTTIALRNEGQTLHTQNPLAFEECVTNCQAYRDQIEKKDNNFFPYSKKNKTDNNIDISDSADLFDKIQLSQPNNSVDSIEKAKQESALNAFAINFIINPSEQVEISEQNSETGSQISNQSESESVTGVLTKNEGEDSKDEDSSSNSSIGLNSASQIKELFCKVFDIPETMPYFPHGSSVQNYQIWKKYQTTYGSSGEKFAETLKVPRGLPSVIMAFGDYTVLRALTKLFKKPKDRKKSKSRKAFIFKEALNEGTAAFYKEKGQTPLTEKIVFQVKKAIGLFATMDTQVDHVNMEYTRGGVEVFLTGRPRKIIDRNGAAVIPAQSNRIRGFPDNSFIADSSFKFNGLVKFLYSLFTYSLRDDWVLFSLELRSAPFRYSTDTKTKKKIEDLAAELGIEASDIDIKHSEMLKGFNNLCNGALYEASRLHYRNYAKYNLPLVVEVLLMDACIQLHNVRYLLEVNKKILFKNKDSLQEALVTIILKLVTLQKLLGFIHEKNKGESGGEYGFEESAPLIESFFQDFIIDTLLQIEGVHDNSFTGGSRLPPEISQEALQFCDEQQERVRFLKDLFNTSEGLPFYSDALNRLKSGEISDEQLITNVPFELYRLNQDCGLHRISMANLFGPAADPAAGPMVDPGVDPEV